MKKVGRPKLAENEKRKTLSVRVELKTYEWIFENKNNNKISAGELIDRLIKNIIES